MKALSLFGGSASQSVSRARVIGKLAYLYLRRGSAIELSRALAPLTFPDPPYPRTLSIEFTNACQAKCSYCPTQHSMRRVQGFMSSCMFSTVLTQVKYAHPQTVRVIGSGEPTLHPRLREMIQALGGTAPVVTLTTNGQLLTERNASAALDVVDIIEVSVDSDNGADYDRVREGATYKRLTDNLRLIRQLRKERRSKTMIEIRVGIRPSQKETERFIEHWHPFGDVIVLQKLRAYSSSDPDLYPLEPSGDTDQCALLFKYMNIRWNGDVPLCQYSAYQFGAPDGLLLGNVASDDLVNLWNSRLMRQYRNGHRRRDVVLTPICKGCAHRWPSVGF